MTVSLTLNQIPLFPAHVRASNGLKAVIENGVDVLILPSFGELVPVPAVTKPASTYFMAWDKELDYYQTISFDSLATNLAGRVLGGTLTALVDLEMAANKAVYFTSPTVSASYDLSPFVRGISGSADSASFRTAIGLGNVNNTSDVNKPVSTAQQMALDLKLNKAGGTLTGDVLFGPGTGGNFSKIQTTGDVLLNRGNGTGYTTWAGANQSFGWDGSSYVFGSAGPVVSKGGYLQAETGGVFARYYETGEHTLSGAMATEFGTSLADALRGFVSTQQTWTLGSALVVAHGRTYIPKNVSLIFVCKVAANGYAVGDRLPMAPNTAASDVNYAQAQGYTVHVDATNVRVSFGTDGISVVSKGGGGVARISPTNFDVIVVARP